MPKAKVVRKASKKGKKKRTYPANVKGSKKQRRKHAKDVQRVAQDIQKNGGQPSTYDPAFCTMAKKLCEMGATDAELAEFFGVTVVTIWNWGTRHQEFFNACRRGKDAADERVVRDGYAKATGYSYPSEKIVVVGKRVVRVPTMEHVPPSDNQIKFWLTNRDPENWKDRSETGFDPDKPLKIIVKGGLPTGK